MMFVGLKPLWYVIFVRPVQPLNASVPMLFTDLGSHTSVSVVMFRKPYPSSLTGYPQICGGTSMSPVGSGLTGRALFSRLTLLSTLEISSAYHAYTPPVAGEMSWQ